VKTQTDKVADGASTQGQQPKSSQPEGEESACDVSAKEVFDQLHHRFGPSGRAVSNERRHDRHKWVTPLTVLIEKEPDHKSQQRDVEVTTHDISRGGFSFMFKQYLHPGTRIRTRFNALPGCPIVRGIVRNCIHLGATFHRIGVEFAAPQDDDPTAEFVTSENAPV
jgi:hypothetical protein